MHNTSDLQSAAGVSGLDIRYQAEEFIENAFSLRQAVSESEFMSSAGDHILLVENDPQISDLIARQTLRSVGYQVDVVSDTSTAIKYSVQTPPDLIIANLNLPGLSAKDMIVALSSQGVTTPVLVIANKGQEHDIIQAFRLGAADYIFWPARDAEVLSAVERVLNRVHDRQDRRRLDSELNTLHQELQRKGRDLSVLIQIGRAVNSVTKLSTLFQRIVDGALQVSDANIAWLLVRDEKSREYLLFAQRGLPEAWAGRMNKPIDDGVSKLVTLSGETLSIDGEPLSRFRVASLGRSVCAVPIKVRKEVIGILLVVRREARPFDKNDQTLLEAVADYATISLINTRLFQALNSSALASREAEKRQKALLESIRSSFYKDLKSAIQPIDLLLSDRKSNVTELQREALKTTRTALERMMRTLER